MTDNEDRVTGSERADDFDGSHNGRPALRADRGNELPEGYYLTHFLLMLQGIRARFSPLLDEEELHFIRTFEELDVNAQALYVRLINRKPTWFRCSRLAYDEIDIPDAVKRLAAAGFVSFPTAEDVGPELLKPFSLTDRRRLFRSIPGLSAGSTEAAILQPAAAAILAALDTDGGVIRKRHEDICSFLQFLYFNNLHDDHTTFVLKDMGLRVYRAIDESQLVCKFADRYDARLAFRFACARRALASGAALAPDDVQAMLSLLEESRGHAVLQLERDKTAHALGSNRERAREQLPALQAYSWSSLPESTERRIRLLARLRRTDEALSLCAEVVAREPESELAEFARGQSDILERRSRRYRKTALQRASETIVLPDSFRGQVERGVCAYFEDQGFQSWHCENTPWNNCFGLLCWDVLHDTLLEQPASPFHVAPADMRSRTFFERRRDRFHHVIDSLTDRETAAAALRSAAQRHFGTVNAFVGWHEHLVEECVLVVGLIGLEALKRALYTMAEDPVRRRAGFPDLLVWRDTAAFLCEVKSENDGLSFKQFGWIERLRSWGLDVRVLNVCWG